MVSGVSSVNTYQYQPQTKSNVSLTDDEKTAVKDLVSKYDPSSMSKSDFTTMMDEIKELGITPSEDIKEILDETGFEKPEGMGRPSGPPKGAKTEMPAFLSDLFQQQEDGSISQEDFDVIIQNLQNSFEQINGNFIDESV